MRTEKENKNVETGVRQKILLLLPVFFCLLAIVLMKFVFLIGYVPTESMTPTLKKGSIILGVRVVSEYEDGDVVIFKRDNELLVKRIAATEGKKVIIKGESLVVPNGKYYMLGDNSENSYDSRFWDEPFIEKGDIVAKVLFV